MIVVSIGPSRDVTFSDLTPEEQKAVEAFSAIHLAHGFEVKASEKEDVLLVISRQTGEVWLTKPLSEFRGVKS